MDLYYLSASAPCRAVLLTARALGIDLNLKVLDVLAGEQLKPDFVKLNPQHIVPTLVDGEFVLWESRAIMIYLVEKYGSKDDTLYPKSPKDRAVINQRLYFDMGTIFQSLANYYYPPIFFAKEPVPEDLKKAENAVELLNTLLEGHEYAVGDHLTLADFTLIASTSTFEITGFDFSRYPNVARWMQKCKENILGYEEINQLGLDAFAQLIHPTSTV